MLLRVKKGDPQEAKTRIPGGSWWHSERGCGKIGVAAQPLKGQLKMNNLWHR